MVALEQERPPTPGEITRSRARSSRLARTTFRVGIFKKVLVGGNFDIPFYWDLAIVAAFALAIYYLAMHLRRPESKVDEYAEEVYSPPAAE